MKFRKEYTKFLIFLTVIIVLTPFLMDIIARSWRTELMETITGIVRSIDPNGVSILINIVVGFYIGSIIFLFVDRYKKIQAILLLIGIYVMSNYMSKSFDTDWNIIYIVIGSIIGMFLGRNPDDDIKEFKKAANNVSLFSIFYAVSSFLIIYISPGQDNSNFIKDMIVMFSFAFFFGKLMSYPMGGPKIFVLGPARSGKTMFLAGCYLRMLKIAEIPTMASEDLLRLIEELHSKGIPWPQRTGKIDIYQFTYEIGNLFPKATTMRTIDYPGVFLEHLSDYMYTTKDINKVNEEEKRYMIAAKEIINADNLIFIVDGEQYPNFENMGITYYTKIVNKLKENKKTIKPYIVVTKSDIFMSEYEKFGNREDYEGFKQFAEKKFVENVFFVQLLNTATNATFYPVFFYTVIGSGSKHIPMRDENGNVYTYGFDKFMDRLSDE